MNQIVAIIQVLLLAVVVSGCAAEVNPEQSKAVAEIENSGARSPLMKRAPTMQCCG